MHCASKFWEITKLFGSVFFFSVLSASLSSSVFPSDNRLMTVAKSVSGSSQGLRTGLEEKATSWERDGTLGLGLGAP